MAPQLQMPAGFIPDGFVPDDGGVNLAARGGDTIRGEDPNAPSLRARLLEALGHAAQPESVGDFLSLVIPSGAAEAVSGLKDMARLFRQATSESPTLRGILPKLVEVMRERPKTLQDFQARGFNDLTLAEQSRHLPQTPAPIGRAGAPVGGGRQTFNDLPLAQQMEHLPQTSAPMRRSGPPIGGGRQTFNDLPLAQQMEHLPETPAPQTRGSQPPNRPQQPFNELPLYRQMEYLPEPPPAPARVLPEPLPTIRPPETPPAVAPSTAPAKAGSAAARRLTAEERQAVDALVEQGYTEADVLAELEKVRQPSTPIPKSVKPILNAAEMKEYLRLTRSGKAHKEAMELIDAQRGMVERLGSPTSEEMRRSVQKRNATGRWED